MTEDDDVDLDLGETEEDRRTEILDLMTDVDAYPGYAGEHGKFKKGGVPGGSSPWPGSS
jgi:hypothetical protein